MEDLRAQLRFQGVGILEDVIISYVEKHVHSVEEVKDREIADLTERVRILSEGGSYYYRHGRDYYGESSCTYSIYTNDSQIKEHVEAYKLYWEQQQKSKADSQEKELQKKYDDMIDALKLPWYIKIIKAIRGHFNKPTRIEVTYK